MTAKSPQELFLTAARIAATAEFPIAQPLSSNSEVHLRRLAETVDPQRCIVTMARIPPGKESFIYHAHKGDEESLCIISGRGEIGDQSFEVGSGDSMVSPVVPIGHHLTNPDKEDLAHVRSGERGRAEVGEIPKQNGHLVFAVDGIYMADSNQLRQMSFEEWIKKT